MSVPLRRRRCRENPRRGAWRGVVTSVTPLPPLTTAILGPGDTTWTVPEGVTLIKRLRLWGAGGDGSFCPGGGGSYTEENDVAVTPGQVFTVNIPAHNSDVSTVFTWFDTDATYTAESGQIGSEFSSGRGGLASNSLGTIKFSGGSGGDNFGGGGGAAGPDGDGAAGGEAGGSGSTPGAGGGAADGGTVGADNTAGGLGGSIGAFKSGGDGSGLYPDVGNPGVDNPDLGGGGGGGGPGNNPGTSGGAGGQPGGGAGGARFFAVAGAIGGDGQIVIEF